MAFDEAAYGNSVVIELLEKYLQEARDKPIGFAGVILLGWADANQPVAAVDWAGSANLEIPALEATDKLRKRIELQIDSWQLPERDPDLDDSFVVWNLAHGPLGFDFISWLVNAEMIRRASGAPAPLKVGFFVGKNAIKIMRMDNRQGWLDNVFRPAMNMLGAVEDPIQGIFGHFRDAFTTGAPTAAYRRGEAMPMFASGLPPRRPGCVTITLREANHWQFRNSNLAAWRQFAAELKQQGEDVVFVRDTAKAEEPLPGFDTDPQASINLQVRVSLYEGAKCNLCCGGGPWQMLLYSKNPWLAIFPIDTDPHGYAPNSPGAWHRSMGIEAGEQFPWQTENQRIVWLDDNYDNIRTAWESLPLNHLGNRRYGT